METNKTTRSKGHISSTPLKLGNRGYQLVPVKYEGLWGSHLNVQPTAWLKFVDANDDIKSQEDFPLTTHVPCECQWFQP